MGETRFQKTYRKLSYRIVFATGLILALFLAKQIVIQYQIVQNKDSSYIIDISGRQRMLSQKITKDLLLIQKYRDVKIKEEYVSDLKESLDIWEKSYIELLNWNKTEKFISVDKSVISSMFDELEPSYRNILESADSILTGINDSGMSDTEIDSQIDIVLKNEPVYLNQMNDIVSRYDYDAKQWLKIIQITHMVMLTIILCIAVSIIIAVYIPLIHYLKNVATKDELTGMYNRHFLDDILDEEISKSDKLKTPLSGVLLDLDHFKRVNDEWGHPVGDSVLKFTAEIIMKTIRISDYAFRIGGEEFLVLMPKTDSKGAVKAADKIRRAIEEATHPVIGNYTVSLGVAERREDELYHELYKRIDEALYQAKNNGRNCVVEAEKAGGEQAAISLKWNKQWNCGEEKIDFQHKELFRMVSQLANNTYGKQEKEDIIRSMNAIFKHVRVHFDYEEKVLGDIGYEDLENHKRMHASLLQRAEEIKGAFLSGEIDETKVLVLIFDEIIVEHLLNEDIRFFHCFEKSSSVSE